MDETARKKVHNYVTIFADLDSHRVVHTCEGKGSDTVVSFVITHSIRYRAFFLVVKLFRSCEIIHV